MVSLLDHYVWSRASIAPFRRTLLGNSLREVSQVPRDKQSSQLYSGCLSSLKVLLLGYEPSTSNSLLEEIGGFGLHLELNR